MRDCWEYYAAHADEAARFDAAMASLTRGLADVVVDSYDFARFGTVVDVGGGDGTLLAAILRRCPETRGVLFDVEHVVERARPSLQAAGVSERCELAGGNFLVGVPPGGDCYVLKWVLHDWDDEHCATILRCCREGAGDTARLVIVERVLPEKIGPDDLDGALSDLNMLVMTSGRERTEAEFSSLLAAADFRLEQVLPTGTNVSIVDAVPV